MNALQLGPFALPLALLPWLVGLIAAWLVAWYAAAVATGTPSRCCGALGCWR